ncbi:hypothetical protein ACIQT5_09305 [Bacillus safensis]|uniref:hypothetical protein n=1 Tax=Bacillus safensis TaxID=561879 RepID=UPI003812D6C6
MKILTLIVFVYKQLGEIGVEKVSPKEAAKLLNGFTVKMKLKTSKGKAWSQSIVYSLKKRVEFAEQR